MLTFRCVLWSLPVRSVLVVLDEGPGSCRMAVVPGLHHAWYRAPIKASSSVRLITVLLSWRV